MKKLLFVINNLDGGGAEKVLVDLLNNLDKEKYSIDLFLFEKQGIYLEKLDDNIKVFSSYSIERRWKEHLAAHILCRINNIATRKLFMKYNKDFTHEFIKHADPEELYRYFIGNRQYDVEIAFLEGIATKLISGSTNKNAKKIAWVHTDLVEHGWFKREFKTEQEIIESYSKFDKVVCVSEKIRAVFEKTYKRDAVVKWNPVDSNMIQNKSRENLISLRHDNTFCYVAVGRFTKEKGFERLLNVHARLIAEGYRVQLVIIGKGDLYENLKKSVYDKHLEKSVDLPGFQENPYKYMADADLYVCSSYVEGLSTTVLESLILGLPIVTTDCPGMNELLGNSEYGLITENSEQGLYDGIKKLLDDKTLYEKYKKQAEVRGTQVNIEKSIADIETLF